MTSVYPVGIHPESPIAIGRDGKTIDLPHLRDEAIKNGTGTVVATAKIFHDMTKVAIVRGTEGSYPTYTLIPPVIDEKVSQNWAAQLPPEYKIPGTKLIFAGGDGKSVNTHDALRVFKVDRITDEPIGQGGAHQKHAWITSSVNLHTTDKGFEIFPNNDQAGNPGVPILLTDNDAIKSASQLQHLTRSDLRPNRVLTLDTSNLSRPRETEPVMPSTSVPGGGPGGPGAGSPGGKPGGGVPTGGGPGVPGGGIPGSGVPGGGPGSGSNNPKPKAPSSGIPGAGGTPPQDGQHEIPDSQKSQPKPKGNPPSQDSQKPRLKSQDNPQPKINSLDDFTNLQKNLQRVADPRTHVKPTGSTLQGTVKKGPSGQSMPPSQQPGATHSLQKRHKEAPPTAAGGVDTGQTGQGSNPKNLPPTKPKGRAQG